MIVLSILLINLPSHLTSKLLFFQEFSSDTSSLNFNSGVASIYVTPGISKSSRSNAIAINQQLVPYVIDHIGCPIGLVVLMAFGGLIVCFLCVHFPHAGHSTHSLDVSCCMLQGLIEDVKTRIESHALFLKSAGLNPAKNPVWIMGADLNCDMFKASARELAIRSTLDQIGICVAPPSHDMQHTFIHAETGGNASLHAIDWLGTSEHAIHILLKQGHSLHTQTSEYLKANVEIETPHWPVEFEIDLSRITRYENLQASNSRGHHTRKSKTNCMKKNWKLNSCDLGKFQNNVQSLLENKLPQTSDDFSCAVLASSKGLKTVGNAFRFVDSESTKSLIEQRRQAESRSLARSLQHQVIAMRRQARAKHVEWLASRVAIGNWSSNKDLKFELSKVKPKNNPTIYRREQDASASCFRREQDASASCFRPTYPSKGPPSSQDVNQCETVEIEASNSLAVSIALSEVYGGLAGDEADNELCNLELKKLKVNVENSAEHNNTLIDIHTTLEAIAKAPNGKTPDPQGIVVEGVAAMPFSAKSELQEFFEKRTLEDNWSKQGNIEEDKDKWHDNWKYIDTLLIPKAAENTYSVDLLDFRPIAILCVFLKIYMRCLMLLMQPYLKIKGTIQYGARSFHRCMEIVMILRMILEKSKEWGKSCIIISIDIERAFESVKLSAILKHWEEKGVPERLRYAAFKEIAGERFVRYSLGGIRTDYLRKQRGLCQGSPESSFFFSALISDVLESLDASWKARGFGAQFGKWSSCSQAWDEWCHNNLEHVNVNLENFGICVLAFVDDIYIVAKSVTEGQIMTNELITALETLGLSPKVSKVKWISDSHDQAISENQRIYINGHAIEPSTHIKVLGSMISGDCSERETYLHRARQSWKTFYVWKRVLMAQVDISSRLRVFKATVLKSMTWGLETTRHKVEHIQILATAQKNMVRMMMKLKRKPIILESDEQPAVFETWLDWQIRTMSAAGKTIRDNDACVATLLDNSRRAWSFHVGRFGIGPRENHLTKPIMLWRNLAWWRTIQVLNKSGVASFRHPVKGKPVRFEDSLPIKWLKKCLE